MSFIQIVGLIFLYFIFLYIFRIFTLLAGLLVIIKIKKNIETKLKEKLNGLKGDN